jgi:hypothetical protein
MERSRAFHEEVHGFHESAWKDIIVAALHSGHDGRYPTALANAQQLLFKYGGHAHDMQELYRVVDWLQELHTAVHTAYQVLDGRPFDELAYFRILPKDVLFLRVYPA